MNRLERLHRRSPRRYLRAGAVLIAAVGVTTLAIVLARPLFDGNHHPLAVRMVAIFAIIILAIIAEVVGAGVFELLHALVAWVTPRSTRHWLNQRVGGPGLLFVLLLTLVVLFMLFTPM